MLKGLPFFIKLSWKYDKLYFIYLFVYQILTSSMSLALLVLPKYILDSLLATPVNITIICILVVAMLICLFISTYVSNILQNHIFLHRINVFYHFNQFMSDMLTEADYITIEQKSFIELRKKAEKYLFGDYRGFGIVFERSMDIFGYLITFIGVIAVITTLHPLFLLLFLILAFINTYVDAKIQKKNHTVSLEQVPIEQRASYLMDILSNYEFGMEMRVYQLGDWIKKILDGHLIKMRKFYAEMAKNNDSSSFVTALTMLLQQGTTYFYLVVNFIKGVITIGDFSLYLSSITTFSDTLRQIAHNFVDIRQYGQYYEYLQQYLNLTKMSDTKGGIVLQKKGSHRIEFKDVTFTYPNQTREAIKHVSVVIESGERIAVVGENGAGKTTFIKLLTRLYDPDSGSIIIDGYDIKDIDYKSLMGLFSVVFQNFKLFSMSIKDNVALDKTCEFTDQEVLAVLDKLGLRNKVEHLKNGIHTDVYSNFSENGFQPSGGEAQKIALARAYLRDSDIIILDEPTAALDPKAEDEIYHHFDEIIGDRIAIYITHRLASTRFCDKILVFDKGELVENGKHEELMQKNSKYHELYELQANYYIHEQNVDPKTK